jgi:hypothetical protein
MKVKVNTRQNLEGIDFVEDTPIIPASCELCSHIVVCAIYRAVKPLMDNWPESQRPFNAEEIARICRQFVSKKV